MCVGGLYYEKIGNYVAEMSRYVISRDEWLNKYKEKANVMLVSDNNETVVIDMVDFVQKVESKM